MDHADRCGYYHYYQLFLYSLLQLYGLCMGNFFMLWQYDGGFIRMGTKRIPHTLCLEKTDSLFSDRCTALFYSCRLAAFLEQQDIQLYNRYIFIVPLFMVHRKYRTERITTASFYREV